MGFAILRPIQVVAATGLLLCACNGADWTNVKVASPYPRPAARVNVTVTTSARGPGLEELTQTVTRELVDALENEGIQATVAADSSGSDELRVDVAQWHPGSRFLRWFLGLGAGEGAVVIVVEVEEPSGRRIFEGSVRGYVDGGFFGGESSDAVVAAAHSIADAVKTGEAR